MKRIKLKATGEVQKAIKCNLCGEVINLTGQAPEKVKEELALYKQMKEEGAMILCKTCMTVVAARMK